MVTLGRDVAQYEDLHRGTATGLTRRKNGYERDTTKGRVWTHDLVMQSEHRCVRSERVTFVRSPGSPATYKPYLRTHSLDGAGPIA